MLRQPRRPPTAKGSVASILFGLAFAGIGAGTFVIATVVPALRVRAAAGWTETTCHILDARVVEGRDSEGDRTYRVRVDYRYHVDGRAYEHDRIDFGVAGSTGSRRAATRKLARYPAGREVRCFHDPARPGQAVLDRRSGGRGLAGAVPLAFVLVGLGVIVTGVRAHRQAHRPARPPGDGPIELERHHAVESAPLFVRGGFALAFTAVPVLGLGTLDGAASWLWLLPMAAVALGLQLWFWYGLLAWVGPRVVVTIGQPARLGQRVAVAVSLRGLMAIRHVRARVVGREEASHTVGTETVTDTSTFFERPLAELRGPGASATLQAKVALPVGAVPTLHAAHNHVRWVVAVEADIAWWPDVRLEYELEVGSAEAPVG